MVFLPEVMCGLAREVFFVITYYSKQYNLASNITMSTVSPVKTDTNFCNLARQYLTHGHGYKVAFDWNLFVLPKYEYFVKGLFIRRMIPRHFPVSQEKSLSRGNVP